MYPITAILGRRGDGKTCFATFLAKLDSDRGRKIYANYHLFGIPYEYITLEKVAELPTWLHNATIILDEIQEGADSREIFKKGNKSLTKLATQLRKRQLTLYYTTQVFTMADKRIREQTDYIVECEKVQKTNPTHFHIRVYDRELPFNTDMVNEFIFHGEPIFKYYDTNEVIHYTGEPTSNDEASDEEIEID